MSDEVLNALIAGFVALGSTIAIFKTTGKSIELRIADSIWKRSETEVARLDKRITDMVKENREERQKSREEVSVLKVIIIKLELTVAKLRTIVQLRDTQIKDMEKEGTTNGRWKV